MTSYTNIFGGTPVNTADISYRAFSLTQNTTLIWPSTLVDNVNVVAGIMDVTPTLPGLVLTMPSALEASTGEKVWIRNLGANSFVVNNGADVPTQIALIAPGQIWQLYLQDNTTVGGTWGVVQFGTGTSQADAATLAGLGLKAILTTLNTNFIVQTVAAPFSPSLADRAKLFEWTGGTVTITLPTLGASDNGFFFAINNNSAGGELTIDAPGAVKIDQFLTLVLEPGESSYLIFDGTNWVTLGHGKESFFNVTVLNKDVSTGGTFTLSVQEASKLIQQYTGAPTTNVTIVTPQIAAQYYVYNNMTSLPAITFTFSISGGQSYLIPQGHRLIFYSDGTNLFPIPTTFTDNTFTFANGTAADPPLDFEGDPLTGIYSLASSGTVSFSSVGNNVADIGATGFETQTQTYKRAGVSIFSLMKAYGR